ncbi:MAG: ABC transporter ATP-binding protein [Thermomicrobiales bacterium]|nr:ABC transporter ATP-binding protein [Thermomicrobiales bacterium]
MTAVAPVVAMENVVKEYAVRGQGGKGTLRALDGIDLQVARGEIVGVVGESGCGKSTLAKLVVRMESPSSGRVLIEGQDAAALSKDEIRTFPRKVQLVFQDPYGALAPRMTVGGAIEDPLRIHGIGDSASRKAKVSELLTLVGLGDRLASRYPHQLSGGQRQRVNIARALALEPEILVLDEPVSSLDVSVQAQVLNLLRSLQQQLGLTYLFISHDLRVVRYLCQKIAVMYLGNVVEYGTAETVFSRPRHPYTLALLNSIPDHQVSMRDQRSVLLRGEVPSPIERPSGCPFHTRCPMAREICSESRPMLREIAPGQWAACHFSEDVPALGDQERMSAKAP